MDALVRTPRKPQPGWTKEEEAHLDLQQQRVTRRSFNVAEDPRVHQTGDQWVQVLNLHNAGGKYSRTMDGIKHKWREVFNATCAAHHQKLSDVGVGGASSAGPLGKRSSQEISDSADSSPDQTPSKASFSSTGNNSRIRDLADGSLLADSLHHNNDFPHRRNKRVRRQEPQDDSEQEAASIGGDNIQRQIQATDRRLEKLKASKSANHEEYRDCVIRSGEIEIEIFGSEQRTETLKAEKRSLDARRAGYLERTVSAAQQIEALEKKKGDLEEML